MRDDLKDHIEKYVRGELSPSEMHALEKRALDDPFLADAIEGALELGGAQFSADVRSLQSQITSRSATKIVPIWVWPARIAAGLLLIVLSMYVIINLTQKDSSEKLALNEVKKPEPTAPKEELTNNDPLPSDTKDDVTPVESDRDRKKSKDVAREVASNAQRSDDESPAATESEVAFADQDLSAQSNEKNPEVRIGSGAAKDTTLQGLAIADNNDTYKPSTQGYISEPAAPAKSKSPFKNQQQPDNTKENKLSYSTPRGYSSTPEDSSRARALTKITGRVVSSEDSIGLPGVNVVIKGTNVGTVTDLNGFYKIDLDDPSTATLVYSFIGLESIEVPVANKPSLIVEMNQDVSQLSEVVVTGYGEPRDEDKIYATFEMAEPAGGKRAFKKYLEEKMVYPRQALENQIEGKVTIQFTVESSGKLSNFNVLKGIGYGCDEEVIRLVKQGPKWSATKRNDAAVKGKVKVRMRFTLPKKK